MYLPCQQTANQLNYPGKFPSRMDIAENESESVSQITTVALIKAILTGYDTMALCENLITVVSKRH